jgi:uncharacterized protein (DUF1697 family)
MKMLAIALLRAVNLPAHNKVGMAPLCGMLLDLEFGSPRSLLQSGNLVFEAASETSSSLERRLEKEAKRRLGLETDFFVRTAKEWRGVLAANPFPAEAERDPGHLLVLFLKDSPGRGAVAELEGAITGREVVRVVGRQAYIVYPDGVGRSRLTTALLERKLRTRATGRNWNTVVKLGRMVLD